MTGGLRRRSATDVVRPTINVTPLVDVVLVLLIIFMVVAPHLEQDVALELPSIFNADQDPSTYEPFKVAIPSAGQYFFHGQLYDLDRITAQLQAEHAADPLRRLVLRADARLRYADVRVLQKRLQEVGFPGMSFIVTQKHRYEDAPPASQGAAAATAGDAVTGE